jgi:hypothetical protein
MIIFGIVQKPSIINEWYYLSLIIDGLLYISICFYMVYMIYLALNYSNKLIDTNYLYRIFSALGALNILASGISNPSNGCR